MRSVLVIDDERPTLSMFSLLLEAMGYTVLTADSGAQGLEIFERERPRIVFTDIKMPDLDGLAVLSRIKAKDPTAEVIVVTGHGDVELALNSLNLDAADFIDKPIRAEALSQALARAEERLCQSGEWREQVEVRHAPQATVVGVRGRLSSSSEGAMSAASAQARSAGKAVLVSLEASAELTGAGIALVTHLLLECAGHKLPVAVCAPRQSQRNILEAAGVSKAASVYEAEAQALAALSQAESRTGE